MARFSGKVGYVELTETKPGLWQEEATEHSYSGSVIRNTRALAPGDQVNDNVNVSNIITVVADAYAIGHFYAIRYVWWAGVKWTVTNVEVQSPRLLLTLGGIYHGQNS